MRRRPTLLLLSGGLGLTVIVGLLFWNRPQQAARSPVPAVVTRAPEAVAALGQLEPAGDIRRLAAPVSGFGGTPRVAELLVNEGDPVKVGHDDLAVERWEPLLVDELRVHEEVDI